MGDMILYDVNIVETAYIMNVFCEWDIFVIVLK